MRWVYSICHRKLSPARAAFECQSDGLLQYQPISLFFTSLSFYFRPKQGTLKWTRKGWQLLIVQAETGSLKGQQTHLHLRGSQEIVIRLRTMERSLFGARFRLKTPRELRARIV